VQEEVLLVNLTTRLSKDELVKLFKELRIIKDDPLRILQSLEMSRSIESSMLSGLELMGLSTGQKTSNVMR